MVSEKESLAVVASLLLVAYLDPALGGAGSSMSEWLFFFSSLA
jgi:hypothetical protein